MSQLLLKADWNPSTAEWTTSIQRKGDATPRTVIAKHLVFATGLNGRKPSVPNFAGRDAFKGEVLHTSVYQDALRVRLGPLFTRSAEDG